jgi:hypothetical protein
LAEKSRPFYSVSISYGYHSINPRRILFPKYSGAMVLGTQRSSKPLAPSENGKEVRLSFPLPKLKYELDNSRALLFAAFN